MKDIGPARLLLPLLSFYRSYFPHHPKNFLHHPEIFSSASSNIFLFILKYFPHHPKIFSSSSSNIFLTVLKYFPHSPQIFSSQSSNIFLNIIKYFPLHPQIFSSSTSNIFLIILTFNLGILSDRRFGHQLWQTFCAMLIFCFNINIVIVSSPWPSLSPSCILQNGIIIAIIIIIIIFTVPLQ